MSFMRYAQQYRDKWEERRCIGECWSNLDFNFLKANERLFGLIKLILNFKKENFLLFASGNRSGPAYQCPIQLPPARPGVMQHPKNRRSFLLSDQAHCLDG